jgi:hypothetical protein
VSANVVTSRTNRSCRGRRRAGDGIGLPKCSFRYQHNCPEVCSVGTYPFRYSRSMQSIVNVTRSRIMVSMLGVAIGASLTGG